MQKWEYIYTDHGWPVDESKMHRWMVETRWIPPREDFGWNKETGEWDTDEGRTKWFKRSDAQKKEVIDMPMHELNREGEDGWELVTLLPFTHSSVSVQDTEGVEKFRAFWKRPLTED